MGMYTELILGCSLTENTPAVCINALDAVINPEKYKDMKLDGDVIKFIEDYQLTYLFRCSSYYFGVNMAFSAFWYDVIDKTWHISTRSNIKNYDDEIENFLEYLEPYVRFGSGDANIYAIVTYEEDSRPTIYSLGSLDEEDDPIRYSGEGTN